MKKAALFLSVTFTVGLMISSAYAGNGAPSGSHYNLNIIGVAKDKSADMDNTPGHKIFVPLEGKTSIWLMEGETFQVLDANGTDSDGASFMLPNPDPENDGVTEYSVYARALGKPYTSASMKTCATDPETDEVVCSIYVLTLSRGKGKSTFQNVSKELLYIYYDLDGDGNVERYPLFDDRLQDYFWEYTNTGLKLAQLRFYPVPTEVPAQ